MAQRRNSMGTQQNGEAAGGRFASAPRAGQSDPDEPATSAEPLTRHNEERFRDLVEAAAADGGLDEFLVERDYWMCQVATELIVESKTYPGSYTSMGGGSLLSLAGITERLSEDVDISVTFVDGAAACSSNQSKRLMEECQANVEEKLGIRGARDPNGGGNYFRTVRYRYPSVLPLSGVAQPVIKSDKGLRDAPQEHLITLNGTPYMGRVAHSNPTLGVSLLQDLAPRPILGTHPRQVLADKLDAVCWREGRVPIKGDRALDHMAERIRDHYDIYCLIKWLRTNGMLDADAFAATVERTSQQERNLRQRTRLIRPQRDRPPEGYHTLRAWTPGTQEHSTLSASYPRLRSVVFGELPSFDDVCDMIHSAAGVI